MELRPWRSLQRGCLTKIRRRLSWVSMAICLCSIYSCPVSAPWKHCSVAVLYRVLSWDHGTSSACPLDQIGQFAPHFGCCFYNLVPSFFAFFKGRKCIHVSLTLAGLCICGHHLRTCSPEVGTDITLFLPALHTAKAALCLTVPLSSAA